MSKLKYSITLRRMERATCLLSPRHPAYRQHELYTGIQAELGNLSERCEEKRSSGRTRKSESIDAYHRGRATRSTREVAVMAMEGRSGIIWCYTTIETVQRETYRRYNDV
jgi:hypothetical protein